MPRGKTCPLPDDDFVAAARAVEAAGDVVTAANIARYLGISPHVVMHRIVRLRQRCDWKREWVDPANSKARKGHPWARWRITIQTNPNEGSS
jgi:hypothetical protein